MADSLFDNRYRYDFIYPRGRSGETLRALDTQSGDRPVVIKRPAPNDAPPIRAGQEVSILNERRALMKLSGHPTLTELLADGQFFVGGSPHKYIVIERADGLIIADETLDRARRGEGLPLLETLVILDSLLDLIQLAHARDIVYNDIDAKHLFWNREAYRLKVIDWGNAVFLEGDEVTPQGVSRQSDVFQMGELLYFIFSGGGRLDAPRDADETYRVSFGDRDAEIGPELQTIISKAAHPNPKFRYDSVSDLKRDLAQIREPIEKERNATVERVADRLGRDLSKEDLRGLRGALEPALAQDPGYPPARRAFQEINDRLRDLDVSADLDAVRIYMEGDNWSRAADLLNDLRDKTGPATAPLVELLLDTCVLILDSDAAREAPDVPVAVMDAVLVMFEGNYALAARVLLTRDTPSDAARKLQWLIAERISSHIPDIMLLRPNLYRLELALAGLQSDGVNVSDANNMMKEIEAALQALTGDTTHLAQLRDGYRQVVDQLMTLNRALATLAVQHQLSNRKLPLNALDRAVNATMALADNMHVVGKQAAASPRDARNSLDISRQIDPTNPLWDTLNRALDSLYELLQSYQTYVPVADGSDLERWLSDSRRDLAPFLERLFDEMLAGMVDGLSAAGQAWQDYQSAVVEGNRVGAVTDLTRAADAVGTVSPTLAGWLNQLRAVIDGAQYVERHAVFGGLGRALADGWLAYDRGRLQEAEQLGKQAIEIARDETARAVAARLSELSTVTRDWVERNGVTSSVRTNSALRKIDNLFTEEEMAASDDFARQMPSRETYLKAMNRGLTDIYARTNSAAARLFFFKSLLLGALEAHDANLDDAQFWREVAVRTLSEHGPRHAATRILDEFIEVRRDILAGAAQVHEIHDTSSLENIESTRRELEDNPQARPLAGAIQSLREFELSLRDWTDGEFRAAGLKLENAIKGAAEAEQTAAVELTPYREWLNELQAAAAELHTQFRQMRQSIERLPAEPDPVVGEAHHRAAALTGELLGPTYAAQLDDWRDTYDSFLATYTDHSVRRSVRLERFNELFRAMFIDRHPAYALYRHWYDLTENAPEFPPPPTDDPTPRVSDDAVIAESEYQGSAYIDEDPPPRVKSPARRRRPSLRLILVLVVVVIGVIVGLNLTSGDNDSGAGLDISLTLSDTPDSESRALQLTSAASAAVVSGARTSETPRTSGTAAQTEPPAISLVTPTLAPQTPLTPEELSGSVAPEETATPTDTNTPRPPTDTPTPSDTPTPTVTWTPSNTPTPTVTPTPTLPPAGLQGWQDLFSVFARVDELPWSAEQFAPSQGAAGWRLGVGVETPGDELILGLEPGTLDRYLGNDAPSRIRRTDATLSLTTFDPALLESEDVYFGVMLESVEDPTQRVGLYIQVDDLNVVNLWLRVGDELEFVSQRSVNAVVARVRLERDPVSGNVLALFNDSQVGVSVPFIAPEAPVRPLLFVKDGGVIVGVTSWRVNLR